MKRFIPLATIPAVLVGVLLSAPAQGQNKLAEGAGKAVVERVCSQCHTLDRITTKALSKANWIKMVQEMLGYGAKASDEDLDTVVEYLAAKYPEKPMTTININKAAVMTMVRFFEISPDDAETIFEYRDKNGDFKVWEDVEKITGIDLKKLEAKKDKITF